jgi:hypothetical protein
VFDAGAGLVAARIDSNTRGRERVRQLLGCGSGVVEGLRADLEAEFLNILPIVSEAGDNIQYQYLQRHVSI